MKKRLIAGCLMFTMIFCAGCSTAKSEDSSKTTTEKKKEDKVLDKYKVPEINGAKKTNQLGEVSKVVPIDKLSIVFTLIFAFLLLKEPFTGKTAVGALLITAGTLVLAL